MKNEKPRGCKAPGFLINSFAFTLGVAPLTRLTFFITEKDPAGRTLQAAPCGPHLAGRTLRAAPCWPPLQKASTPSRRPQDKPILSRAFYNALTLGAAPQTRPSFFIAK